MAPHDYLCLRLNIVPNLRVNLCGLPRRRAAATGLRPQAEAATVEAASGEATGTRHCHSGSKSRSNWDKKDTSATLYIVGGLGVVGLAWWMLRSDRSFTVEAPYTAALHIGARRPSGRVFRTELLNSVEVRRSLFSVSSL